MLGFIQSVGGSPSGKALPPRQKKILAAVALATGVALAAVVTQQSTQLELTTRSTPAGIVNTTAYHDAGSTVSVPVAPQTSNGYRFSYWTLNGARQQDAYGLSVNAFSFKILENSSAVAVYTLESADADADGIRGLRARTPPG